MRMLALPLMVAAALFDGVAGARPGAQPDQVIRELLASGRDADLRWPDLADVRSVLDSAYARNGWAALWSRDGRPTPAARGVIQQLLAAGQRGLEPSDYDAAWLDSMATAELWAAGPASERDLGRFDVALSVAAVRLAGALRRGRVAPESLAAGLVFPRSRLDVPALLDSLRSRARPGPVFDALEPTRPEYLGLRRALIRYRLLAADSGLVALAFPKLMRPGDVWPGAPRLRRLLVALGDLPDSLAASGPADTLYGADLALAVRRYQRRHGITDDAVVGPVTAGWLSRPMSERVRQIGLALERERWLPRVWPRRVIVVNLATFELSARDAELGPPDGRLDLAVIVGEAEEHETPQFTASLRTVVFRPWWEVPLSIMRNEIRPAALADSRYLEREGMELWVGDEMVPASAENIQRIGHGVRVRQRPGPANALGDVKFLLPNRYDVYLHDTPARHLFPRARRDFSHGCIRVSDAAALARFVLRGLPEWTDEAIEAAMSGDVTEEVELKDPIPVYVIHQTAVARPDGEIAFFSDLYGADAALEARLQHGYPYRPIPE